MTASGAEPSVDRIGRYEIVRPLGHGGMGQVYLVRDPELERQVAIKLLRNTTQDGLLRAEARALAALRHPGIVTIFEIGECDGQQFIAMEYLPGRSLRQILDERGASREQLVAICARVAVAVAAAHAAKILHRDIKPENVVVGDDLTEIKVVDFGIARRLHEQTRESVRAISGGAPRVDALVDAFTQTIAVAQADDAAANVAPSQTAQAAATLPETLQRTGTIFGTPAYMAPEVLMGEELTSATDVYSLGVMLYECLAGRRPYEAASLHELLARVIDGERPEKLDDPLDELVARMLAHAPSERPPLDEIARALEPPPAPLAPAEQRSRTPLVAVTAAGLVALAVAGVVWSRSGSSATAAERTVAVQDIEYTYPAYSSAGPEALAVADALGMLIGDLDGVDVIAPELLRHNLQRPASDEHWIAAATHARADFLVRGAFIHSGSAVTGMLEVIDLRDPAHVVSLTRSLPVAGETELMNQLAEEIGGVAAPGVTRRRPPNAKLGSTLHRAGAEALLRAAWRNARPYLELAVVADPQSYEAWVDVATVRSWMLAPADAVAAAVDTALAIAPAGTRKDILEGASAFLKHDHERARAILAPLEGNDLPVSERRDVLYYLGEVSWHDGELEDGYRRFRAALALERKFKPATIHAVEYALARGKIAEARELFAMQDQSDEASDVLEFAAGNYAAITAKASPYAFYAGLVLGREPRGIAPMGYEHDAHQVARAIERGELATARREFARAWPHIRDAKPLGVGSVRAAEVLGEIVIAAELADETRQVIAFLREHAPSFPPAGTYKRLALLAAPILGDRPVIAGLNRRQTRIAQAIDAELAGDRVRAATVLAELIGDPDFVWDYPERLALLRNLRALGRDSDADKLCAATMRPRIYRHAYQVARRACANQALHE